VPVDYGVMSPPGVRAWIPAMSEEQPNEIDFGHLQAIDMRVGRITASEEFPAGRKPAWRRRSSRGV
jgi:hypothetical protein